MRIILSAPVIMFLTVSAQAAALPADAADGKRLLRVLHRAAAVPYYPRATV